MIRGISLETLPEVCLTDIMEFVSRERCLWPLICPVCEKSLTEMSGVLRCVQGHAFDVAREGYVNLLLSEKKVPKIQGDAKEMLQARRRFLDEEHYRALSDQVNELLISLLPWFENQTPITIIDAGCGEGYYTGRLQARLGQRWSGSEICVFGVDIAKEAARLASRRSRHTRFVVADIRRKLPFADHSAQILLNLFAPRNMVEFSRLSAQQGIMLIVIPSEHHLQELRELAGLLSIEKQKREQIVTQCAGQFELDSVLSLSFDMRLEPRQMMELVQMTPNYWHMSQESQQRLAELEVKSITAGFELLLFRNLSAGHSA